MLSERVLLPIFRKWILTFQMSHIWIYLSFYLRTHFKNYDYSYWRAQMKSYINAKKELIQFSLLARLDKLLMRYEKLFSAFSLLSIAKLQNKDLWLNCNAWRTVLMLPFSNHYHIMIVRQNFCSMKCIGLSN